MLGLHLHRFRTVRDTGGHLYQQCQCGKRRVLEVGRIYQPVDRGWVETGEWTPLGLPPVAPHVRYETGCRGVQPIGQAKPYPPPPCKSPKPFPVGRRPTGGPIA